jgi:hypothetical protein
MATGKTYFGRSHDGAEKNTLKRPFLQGYVKMGLGSIDVDERCEDDGGGYFSAGDDVFDKSGERGYLGPFGHGVATGRGWTSHGVVDCIYDSVDDIFCGWCEAVCE